MNRMLIGGFAVLLLAGGVIAIATATVMWNRDRQAFDDDMFDSEIDANFVAAANSKPEGSEEGILKRYTLLDQHDQPFKSESLQGKVHVVSFFFSSCPSTCALQNQQVANLQREFGDEGVEFVSITCDPAKDTPAVLREYASKLNAKPGWWFLTSPDLLYLRRIAGEIYTIMLEKQTHSSRLLLVDRNGEIRDTCHYNEPEPMKKFKAEIAVCLEEPVGKPATEASDPASETVSVAVEAEQPPSPE